MKEPFISVLISEEKLNERIAQLGEQISKDYEGKEVKLICILKGSIIFTCELAKRITVPVKFDFMQVSSYGSGTSSSGQIKIKKDLDESWTESWATEDKVEDVKEIIFPESFRDVYDYTGMLKILFRYITSGTDFEPVKLTFKGDYISDFFKPFIK